MKYIKLNQIDCEGNEYNVAIDCSSIVIMSEVLTGTKIHFNDGYDDINVTESIDEIIELIEAPINEIVKIIEKMTGNNDNTDCCCDMRLN